MKNEGFGVRVRGGVDDGFIVEHQLYDKNDNVTGNLSSDWYATEEEVRLAALEILASEMVKGKDGG